MRSYRDPNDVGRNAAEGPGTRFLGAAQVVWLKQALKNSSATWKVIAAGLPIGLARRSRAKICRRALEFFGHVAIDGASEILIVTLKDIDSRTLWSIAIEPKFPKWEVDRS